MKMALRAPKHFGMNTSSGSTNRACGGVKKGFTLIELLIVVAKLNK
jgi:type II secretory pathway pseudopilin PulG